MACVLVLFSAACGSSAEPGVSASEPENVGTESAGDPDQAACDSLGRFIVASSEIDGSDLGSLRSGMARLAGEAGTLAEVAPDEIASAAAELDEWAQSTKASVDDPTFEVDPDIAMFLDTAASARAGEQLSSWSETHCGDLTSEVRPETVLVVCLGVDPSDELVDLVNPRLQIPTGRGSESELPPGVQGVSWDYANGEIRVTLDRFITPEERDQLDQRLREPPVLDVVELEKPTSSTGQPSWDPTPGCPAS